MGPLTMKGFSKIIADTTREIGEGAHIISVCQPTVETIAALADMSSAEDPCTPLTVTLMAGPIDPKRNPTAVNKLATDHPISWFEKNVTVTVPNGFNGAGRKIYPGLLQLTGFMMMNPERHLKAQKDILTHLGNGEKEKAKKLVDFYDEYLAVLDLDATFYLQTLEFIFQHPSIMQGVFPDDNGRLQPLNLDAIGKPINGRRTALITVEGEKDDVVGLGQTEAAHEICKNVAPNLRHHFLAHTGHYGVFSGKKWRTEIYPRIRDIIFSVEANRELKATKRAQPVHPSNVVAFPRTYPNKKIG